MKSIDKMLEAHDREFANLGRMCFRVLKPGRYCAILVGDTRRARHYTPIAFRVMQAFLEAGFALKEDIIKAQHNTQTEGLWANLSRKQNFLLIMHEHLFVFRKPLPGESRKPFLESTRWW
jgi:DNA modification methylase